MAINFEEQIGPAVRATGNEIRRCMDAENLDTGITGIRSAVLGFLCHVPGPLYQKDVEKWFNIRRAAATSLLQGMEEQGLIRRETAVHDARLKSITVTEAGYLLEHKKHDCMVDVEERMRSGMTDEEVALLLSLLARVRVNLGGTAGIYPPKEL